MTNRALALLACVAAALVAATALLYSVGGSKPAFARGTLLIQGLDPDKVAAVVIEKGPAKVTLERRGETYTLKEKAGYPASQKKINDLLVSCLEIRCADKVTDDPSNHASLDLADDSKDAVRISFLDREAKPLVGFIKGKNVEKGSGAYVRLVGENPVYTTEDYLYFNTDAMSYIDTKLFEVKKDDVATVSVTRGDESYAIARGDAGEIALQNLPEGKRPKAKTYEDVFGALSSLDASDVARADSLEVKWNTTYDCRLKSGLTYHVKLGKANDKTYVELTADGPGVQSVQITKTESDEELKKKETLLLAEETARKSQAKHAGWLYELSSWKAEKMEKPLADLVEDKPVASAPAEISASHILISYAGAERSENKRTKEDARALADEVLAKAKEEGADFAALAEEYSDAPTKADGGDLGAFRKGAQDPAFEEAAFRLAPGEISPVVETPFGFQIIKRTK
ncbi:MAG: peptidylprolyl isomerase [Planctomycetota bacterium]